MCTCVHLQCFTQVFLTTFTTFQRQIFAIVSLITLQNNNNCVNASY